MNIGCKTFLLAFLLSASSFSQVKIKINNNNIESFLSLNSSSPVIVCNLSEYNIGSIDTNKLKIGSTWTLQDSSLVKSKITKLKRQITNAKNKRQKKQVVKLQTKLKQTKKLLKNLNSFTNLCKKAEETPKSEFIGNPESLNPYHENLTDSEIRHLLDKVAFGGNPALYRIAKEQGLSAVIDALVDGDDQEAALMAKAMDFGSKGFFYQDENPTYAIYNPYVLRAAQVYRFVYSAKPFKEWMLLNLSGHFSVNLNRIGFAYNSYSHFGMREHWDLLINNSLGNFRELALAMLTDKAMNFWLDNKDNQVGAPNQNFARELIELFILGKLDPVSGNSNYEEDSVVAATGYLSGYYEDAVYDPERADYSLAISYENSLHDNSMRSVFSEILGSEPQTFTPTGFVNYVLDSHPGAARFIAERFGGMFLYPGLPENIVSDLAKTLKSNNYQLKPFYKSLLKSEAFFSNLAKESCFTSPLQQSIRLARKLFPGELISEGEYGQRAYYLLSGIAESAGAAGQMIFEPPSVFGWKGSCNINRNSVVSTGEGWLKTQRLLNRSAACATMLDGLNWYELDFVKTLDLQQNFNAIQIVDKVAEKISGRALLPAEKQLLVNYIRTFRGDGYDYSKDPDLSKEWIVRSKIPRLVCLIHDLSFNNIN